jgi:hypothetical protein
MGVHRVPINGKTQGQPKTTILTSHSDGRLLQYRLVMSAWEPTGRVPGLDLWKRLSTTTAPQRQASLFLEKQVVTAPSGIEKSDGPWLTSQGSGHFYPVVSLGFAPQP